jgi:hypothetical protein
MDDATKGSKNQSSPVDRFIDVIEVTAAIFLAVVTLLVFAFPVLALWLPSHI